MDLTISASCNDEVFAHSKACKQASELGYSVSIIQPKDKYTHEEREAAYALLQLSKGKVKKISFDTDVKNTESTCIYPTRNRKSSS